MAAAVRQAHPGNAVTPIRKYPHPYRAMLALCSDLDETPTTTAYFETARFLNTTGETPMGPGVGLETGNTIYFGMPSEQFAYWNTDDEGRNKVRTLIRSGHIDCLHSFGDLVTTRSGAARALDELERHGCHLAVWVDHGSVPANFGADIMQGRGDVPGSDAFHADLTCAFGVRFVWRGRVTSVIGQGIDRSLAGLFNAAHPLASSLTVAREAAKGILAHRGHPKYGPHAHNRILWPAALRSGHRVTEFIRANPSWGGVSRFDTGRGIGEVLSNGMLRRLVQRAGATILYTHLGKARPDGTLPPSARDGLRRLAAFAHRGEILVTTTRRLLGYCEAAATLDVSVSDCGDRELIQVTTGGILDPRDLDGITIYCRRPQTAILEIDGRRSSDIQVNSPDESGQASVSIPWRRLEYPL